MKTLHSWSDEEEFRYFSGQVTYEREVDVTPDISRGTSLILDFGEGTPVTKPDPLPRFNLRAFLEGPIREAAEVYVNDKLVGAVWHPPYILEVTSYLHRGRNSLRIVVGNTAINSLAGSMLPDYRLLNDRFGERFAPQDMNDLRPLPSGILGEVRLHSIPSIDQ
jgi:hypothetical protein